MPAPKLSPQKLLEALQALARNNGNKAAAARDLGLNYKTYDSRIKQAQQHGDQAALMRAAQEAGFNCDDVTGYWVKTDEVSAYISNKKTPASYEEMRDELCRAMDEHAPQYYERKYPDLGEHLIVVDPADMHVGKNSAVFETNHFYSLEVARQRAIDGVKGLMAKASHYQLGKIILVIGNDVLHVDSHDNKTTSGTPQDSAALWWQMFIEAKQIYVAIIEFLLSIAPVHVVFCPSNHDWRSGWFLADSVSSWFRNEPNVSFGDENRQISMCHRKYVQWGNALLGFTHGDGAAQSDLAKLMQFEARQAWGEVLHGYWYVHHLHHKIRLVQGKDPQVLEKDHAGVTVLQSGKKLNPVNNVYIEYLRSPSPADGWHHRNGYVGAPQAVEAFLHDGEGYQAARFTHFFQ